MRRLAFAITLFLLLPACSEKDDPVGPVQNPYRGDVNLNTIAYEIADVVLFSEYFTKGMAVFTIDESNQTMATDINGDGVTLSLADLVYGIRIIIGDAPTKPPLTPVTINYAIDSHGSKMSILGGVECGALRLVVQGQAQPTLLDTEMDMKWEYDGTFSWVLVYSLGGSSFTGDIVVFQGTLISVELATADGAPGIPALNAPPLIFPVDQNYPNPFGPGTVDTSVTFFASQAMDYTVTIFDVLGNEVESFQGYTEAGECTVHLDFSEYKSGVYFYRVEARGETFTRKLMVLH